MSNKPFLSTLAKKTETLEENVTALTEEMDEATNELFVKQIETADVLTYVSMPGANAEVISEIAYNADGVSSLILTQRNKNFVSVIKKSITGSTACTFEVADDGTYTVDNTAGTAVAYVNGETVSIIPGTYFCRVEVDELIGNVAQIYFMESGSDYSHGMQIRNGNQLPASVFTASSIKTMISISAGAKVVFRLSVELGATEYTGYIKSKTADYSVEFGKTVYGGRFNWATGELTETMDSAGVLLANPVVTRLTKKVIALYPDKNVLVSDTGETSILSIERKVDPYKYQNYGLPILALTGDISGMDKDNAVTLDYVYGDRMGTCTCKWQGSSSLAYDKKNYTIKFDTAFEVVEGWGAQNKYCMKANWIDASHARNVVSAKMWGQIVKERTTPDERLSALPNGGAIDGFPCIITINGEFQGLFTWNIPKDGWMYGMGSGTQEAILCADAHVDATRFKGAATLDGDFELEYVSDEDNADWVLTSLNSLINAVVNSDGSDLDTTVAQYLDWESAIDYYILTVLLRGDDMTDKNYLLYTYDGVKWYFGAYDMDCTWGLNWDGKTLLGANVGTTLAGYASIHRVMELIKTYKAATLKARYNALRTYVMGEDNVATTFGNFIGTIPSGVYDMERKRWPGLPLTSVNDLHQVTDWYHRRVAKIDAEVDAL